MSRRRELVGAARPAAREDAQFAARDRACARCSTACTRRALWLRGRRRPVRPDGRHRHQPARPAAGARSAIRLLAGARDRHADVAPRLGRRGRRRRTRAQLALFERDRAQRAGAAPQPRQQRRHRARRRLRLRPDPARASRSTAACRGAELARRDPPGRPSRRRRCCSCASSRRATASATTPPSPPTGRCASATVSLGYADGFLRCWSGAGALRHGEARAAAARPGVDGHGGGRSAPPRRTCAKATGSTCRTACPTASARCGLSQYELLTLLGRRFRAATSLQRLLHRTCCKC